MKYLFYIGTGKYSLSTEEDLLKIFPGDLPGKKRILLGSKDIIRDTQRAYKKLFQKAVDQYNLIHSDKPISSYYCKINESKKLSLATGILLRLGTGREWRAFQEEEKIQTLYEKQFKKIQELLPNFYLVNVTLYFEEAPCLRIVGIPFQREEEQSKLLKIRVSKSNSFNKNRIKEIRDTLMKQIKVDFYELFQESLEIVPKRHRKKKNPEDDYYQMSLFQDFIFTENKLSDTCVT